MRKINLKKGGFFIIDEEDFDFVSSKTWWSNNGYIVTGRSPNLIKLSRHLMNYPIGLLVDHINGDTFDNRKSNLRVCTIAQNMMNQKSENRKGTSRYKGVSFCSRSNRWRAVIKKDKKQKNLGYFKEEIEAAKAYNKEAKNIFGSFSRTNGLYPAD